VSWLTLPMDHNRVAGSLHQAGRVVHDARLDGDARRSMSGQGPSAPEVKHAVRSEASAVLCMTQRITPTMMSGMTEMTVTQGTCCALGRAQLSAAAEADSTPSRIS